MHDLQDPKIKARFWAKVAVIHDDSSCWNWQAFTDHYGYGRFGVAGTARTAHRVAYAMTLGMQTTPPSTIHILHKCDNPACVRPDHLFPGDQRINMQDRQDKGRYKSMTRNPAAKFKSAGDLTADDIAEIKAARARGEKYKDLALRLKVTMYAIVQVEQGRI